MKTKIVVLNYNECTVNMLDVTHKNNDDLEEAVSDALEAREMRLDEVSWMAKDDGTDELRVNYIN